tara:strand:+ start:71 stop:601 length:531 start_codon:yes stop_codon:yes gene_type:complete
MSNQELLEQAAHHSIIVMDAYLKSRSKQPAKLEIFDTSLGFDDNINRLSESIFLLGVFDQLIRTLDTKLENLTHEDAVGFLHSEVVSREELEGYEVWLDWVLKEGEYTQGNYRINDRKIQVLDILFTSGQLSCSKFINKVDGIVPEVLGLDSEHEFYDFKEFVELKHIVNSEALKG